MTKTSSEQLGVCPLAKGFFILKFLHDHELQIQYLSL